MDHIKLVNDRLDIVELMKLVSSPSCGAISIFVGTTRDNFDGKIVTRLVYEAYGGMAEKSMKKICDDIRSRWKVHGIAMYHRLGEVAVEEASIAIAISSEHRAESLEAVQFAMDRIKAEVPIWKKEEYEGDGDSQWKENKESSWIKTEPHEVAEQREDGDNRVRNTMEDMDTLPENRQIKDKNNINKRKLVNEELFWKDKKRLSSVKTEPKEISAREENVVSGFGDFVEDVSPSLIQVKASDEELKRRMEAFIELKRNQVNLSNIRDFCGNGSEETSCARVDAVVVRQKDSKGHLRVRRVLNKTGPQTQGIEQWPSGPGAGSIIPSLKVESKTKCETNVPQQTSNACPPAVEERLLNAEVHLGLNDSESCRPVPKDVYARLKALEDRILFLEGVSPEYLQSLSNNYKFKPSEDKQKVYKKKVYSVDELNRKMKEIEKSIANNSVVKLET